MTTNATTQWHRLLKIATGHLECVGAGRSNWTWGGGTVLMMRYHHRLSHDIDLFLDNPQYLSYLSPRLNENIAATVDSYTEQANHLRCLVSGVGEIDYILAAPVIDTVPELMDVEGHGRLQTMPDREILAQKIHYRSMNFTGRDLFDFVTVTTIRPELLHDPELRRVGEIRRTSLEYRLDSPVIRKQFDGVAVHEDSTVVLEFGQARNAMQKWLDSIPRTTARSNRK